jgi:hypothetical protein
MPTAPLSESAAQQSMRQIKDMGADVVALVPFLWQAGATDTGIVAGNAVGDAELVEGIRFAKSIGLNVFLKPHVWVDRTWAGSIELMTEEEWHVWFERYSAIVCHYAEIAEREHVRYLAIGVELDRTVQQPQWPELIHRVRALYSGELTYSASGIARLGEVPFWPELDFISVNVYPELGQRVKVQAVRAAVRQTVGSLHDAAKRFGKPIFITEVGIRSAVGAQEKPWESPEERLANPDPGLQALVLNTWIRELKKPFIEGILIWRWFSDPSAGGLKDTDFTPQNKPAEQVLRSHWAQHKNR